VFRSALPRILALIAGLFALTVVVSLTLGALAHSNLLRALATGFYIVGVAILIGSFAFGIRGPTRTDWGEGEQHGAEAASAGMLFGSFRIPRRGGVRRRRTSEERADSKRNSVALFLLGMAFLFIGIGFDPARHL